MRASDGTRMAHLKHSLRMRRTDHPAGALPTEFKKEADQFRLLRQGEVPVSISSITKGRLSAADGRQMLRQLTRNISTSAAESGLLVIEEIEPTSPCRTADLIRFLLELCWEKQLQVICSRILKLCLSVCHRVHPRHAFFWSVIAQLSSSAMGCLSPSDK